jgi:hypothetical protein
MKHKVMALLLGLIASCFVCQCSVHVFPCRVSLEREAYSPDGDYVAREVWGACGPPSRYAMQVLLMDARVPPVLFVGPFWPVDLMLSELIFDAYSARVTSITWPSQRQLLIEYTGGPPQCTFFARRDAWRDVQVTFNGPCEQSSTE